MNLTSTIGHSTSTRPPSTRPPPARSHLARQILAAATVAAVLDAAFAFVAYVVIDGRYNLETLLQYIASGAFGDRAFASGLAGTGYATAGFAIHFAIALTYAGFYAASPARRHLNTGRARVLGGIVYGAAIWIFMNTAVLPLTQADQERFLSPWYNAFLIDHALFVGLPIALVIKNVGLSRQGQDGSRDSSTKRTRRTAMLATGSTALIAVVGGATVALASTPDLPPNARNYEAVCHRPGTERQQTLILRERAADLFTGRLGAADAPCGVPLPDTAQGVPIDPAKGYFVEEINNGLFWVTDGFYQMMFLTTGEGVIVVDAPPFLGANILAAIGEVTDEPITHVIYSHSHSDHIGAAGLYPTGATYIAHEDVAATLADAFSRDRRGFEYGTFVGGGPVPIPTVTFDDSYTLIVGNQTLELSFRGPAHEPGNIYIYAPDHKVLMLVDVLFPGWSPFKNLGLAEDVPAYFAAHDEILSFDFDTLVAGHLGRLGTRTDVETNKEYFLDIEQAAASAVQSVDLAAIREATGSENFWLLFDTFFDEAIQQCEETIVPQWVDRLGGADVFTADHCFAIIFSLRLD